MGNFSKNAKFVLQLILSVLKLKDTIILVKITAFVLQTLLSRRKYEVPVIFVLLDGKFKVSIILVKIANFIL